MHDPPLPYPLDRIFERSTIVLSYCIDSLPQTYLLSAGLRQAGFQAFGFCIVPVEAVATNALGPGFVFIFLWPCSEMDNTFQHMSQCTAANELSSQVLVGRVTSTLIQPEVEVGPATD